MLTLTDKQINEIARLQALAKQSYDRYDYPGASDREELVQVAALTDSAAGAGDDGLLARCRGQMWRAVVVAVRYIVPDWAADDGPAQVAIIVTADGRPWGAPFELTGEIAVTAPFDTALLDEDIPDPCGHYLEHTVYDELVMRLTSVAAQVFTRAHRRRTQVAAASGSDRP